MSSKTVWVIEDGEYSDYRVVGVFSSRENAELVLGRLKSGEIAEWELDPAVDKLNAGMDRFYVQILRDGTVREVKADKFSPDEYEHLNPRTDYLPTEGLRVWMFAENEAHAIKIANEKRIQAIANGEWPALAVQPAAD